MTRRGRLLTLLGAAALAGVPTPAFADMGPRIGSAGGIAVTGLTALFVLAVAAFSLRGLSRIAKQRREEERLLERRAEERRAEAQQASAPEGPTGEGPDDPR